MELLGVRPEVERVRAHVNTAEEDGQKLRGAIAESNVHFDDGGVKSHPVGNITAGENPFHSRVRSDDSLSDVLDKVVERALEQMCPSLVVLSRARSTSSAAK